MKKTPYWISDFLSQNFSRKDNNDDDLATSQEIESVSSASEDYNDFIDYKNNKLEAIKRRINDRNSYIPSPEIVTQKKRALPPIIIDAKNFNATYRVSPDLDFSKSRRISLSILSKREISFEDDEKNANSSHKLSVNKTGDEYSSFASAKEKDETSTNVSKALHYLHTAKRRKKQLFKCGTLAYRMQQLLKLKKHRLQIWNYETQKKSQKIPKDSNEIIEFKCKKCWSEFGVNLMWCEYLTSSTSNNNTPKEFLINFGVDLNKLDETLNFQANGVYKLYPPYKKEKIIFKGKSMDYFLNILKFTN